MAEHFASSTRSTPYDPDKKSFVLWTQDRQRPVHGGYLTSMGQQQVYDRSRLASALMPSGFLRVGRRRIATLGAQDLVPGDLVCGTTPSDANTFYLYAPAEAYQVVVGGLLVTLYHVLGGGAVSAPSNDRDYCSIRLPAAPGSGGRFDLVFLEVWRVEINETGTIYAWGSVDSGEPNLVNDLADTSERRGRVNTAVQLRSRLRIVQGVDYAQHPHGLDDTAQVKAWGDGTADTTYTFARQPHDPGLWRAGDGSAAARTALGTTDGYCLAVPIAVVARRNQTDWDANTNHNGAGVRPGPPATPTRPDGLRHDQIAPRDIDDLRLWVAPGGHDTPDLLRDGQQGVMGSWRRGGLRQDDQEANSVVWGNEILRRDTLAGNGARRRWSNEAAPQDAVGVLRGGANSNDLNGAAAYTAATRQVQLDTTHFDANTTIHDAAPTIRLVADGTVVTTSGDWSGLGTAQASATLSSDPSGEFCVEFRVNMPQDTALTRVPSALHQGQIGNVDCFLADAADDLSLANLAAAGALGLLVDRATRGIHDVVRRSALTANANGVARAPGLVWEKSTSDGTIEGCLVTGLTSGQAIDVVHTHTPAASDTLTIDYSHRPPLIPPLPPTLRLDMIAMDSALWVSNVGTGGGTPAQPWSNPMLHIPEAAMVTAEHQLVNDPPLDVSGFGAFSPGLVRLPYRWEAPWEPLITLTDAAEDGEGRPHYGTANQTVAAYGDPLVTAQRHRTVRFGLARVVETAGVFGQGELVLVGLTETADANTLINRAGITDAASTFCAFCIPLKAL